MQLTPITRRGSRRNDAQGYGHFGAPRQRLSGLGVHQGIDLVTDPGEPLYAPLDGDIVREAAYGPTAGNFLPSRQRSNRDVFRAR